MFNSLIPNSARHYVAAILLTAGGSLLAAAPASYTPLLPIPAPRIADSTPAYPGGSYEVANLTDGKVRSEYSSNGGGTNTFVDFEFASPVRLGAFRHVNRNDPGTVAASELVFSDAGGQTIATVPVPHVSTPGGETYVTLPSPVLARRVHWRVTRLGTQGVTTVGGAEISFYAAGEPEATPRRTTLEPKLAPIARKEAAGLTQPLRITLNHPYAEAVDAVIRVGTREEKPVRLKSGAQVVELSVPVVNADNLLAISLDVAGQSVAKTNLLQKPVRPLTVYILPHSHTDIGYTEIQTDIEKKQVQNLVDGMAHAKRTASYPEGARFIWNVEVGWAADLYQRRLNEQQRADFLDAVKNGQVALCGMYLNELTGLCRPEELLRLFRFATKLSAQTGVPIESAMISDVPGYTWGSVPAMTQAGIKYFSTAPNYFDRIGTIMREWENKPFYWLGPDGKSKVLVWIPFWGYGMSHIYHQMSPKLVDDLCEGLEKRAYPYDIAHVRWSGHGDNAVPDPAICEFVKDWNAQYAWPKFIISGTSEAFRALEQRYGSQLPIVRGDWTPYWEDGAGSSALETGMNRASSDRVNQAETLFAMLKPKSYPAAAFEDAYNKVLLYSEHTWGAWCSVSEPERKETLEQWAIKKSYADDADKQSRALLEQALQPASASPAPPASAVDVFNTLSWPRTELVTLARGLSSAGDRVLDDRGNAVPSQRLSSGELVFLARNIEPFAARRFTVASGSPKVGAHAMAQGNVLDSGRVRVRVDEKTGGIVELTAKGLEGNFTDTSGGEALNDFLYLPADDLKDLKRNGPVRISVGERGPLVASLIVESDAPGCKTLRRELRVVADGDYVEMINLVDKTRLGVKSYMAREGKESVNFAFPFNVPDGDMLLDIPFGAIHPEADQMPSACKNWFTVGRWADVSNPERGITWVSLDAPLVQIGGITANLLNSQTNPDVWRKKVDRTQKLYSWAMNNHWGTNYRAYQEGPTVFRFILRPHRKNSPAESSRFATGFSQPLLPAPAQGSKAPTKPLLRLDSPDVLVTALKPSDDGQAIIVRLFGASGKDAKTKLAWARPGETWRSDTSEKPLEKIQGAVAVPAWGVVTLRVNLDK